MDTGGQGSPSTELSTLPRTDRSKLQRKLLPLCSPKGPDGTSFRVLQWNILADGLAQSGDFVKTPSNVLEWGYRAPLVLAEIIESRAELICLQELNHYGELLAALAPLGYAGAFLAKSYSAAERYNCPPDGVAIFYSKRRFKCVGHAQGRTFLDSQGRKQSQGYLQVMLHDKVVGHDILVVTTHLKAKEGAKEEDVRLRQAGQLLESVCQTLRSTANGNLMSQDFPDTTTPLASTSLDLGEWEEAPPEMEPCEVVLDGSGQVRSCARCFGRAEVPVIITGDFNTTPGSLTCQAISRHPLRFKSLWNEQPDLPDLRAAAAHAASVLSGHLPTAASLLAASLGFATAAQTPLAPSRSTLSPPSSSAPAAHSQPVLMVPTIAPATSSYSSLPVHSHPLSSDSDDVEETAQPVHQNCTCGAPRVTSSGGALDTSLHRGTGDGLQSGALRDGSSSGTFSPAAAHVCTCSSGGVSLLRDGVLASPAAAVVEASCSSDRDGGSPTSPVELEFSTWKFRSKGECKRTIDYIFFSGDGKLRPTSRWRMLSEAEIGPAALPSCRYASDHVSVCADFEWDLPALEWAPGLNSRDLDEGEDDWGL